MKLKESTRVRRDATIALLLLPVWASYKLLWVAPREAGAMAAHGHYGGLLFNLAIEMQHEIEGLWRVFRRCLEAIVSGTVDVLEQSDASTD